MPETLYSDVVEMKERVVLYRDDCQLNLETEMANGTTGDKVI